MSSNYVENTASGAQKRVVGRVRSYNEVIEFLNSRRPVDYNESTLQRSKQLDAMFDNISEKSDVILIGGSNGKSSTINFTTKLLNEEGFKVGAIYANHFLSYNERITINGQTINNKLLTEFVNEVINAVEQEKIDATAFEIIMIASMLYFKHEKVDVTLLEVGMGGRLDATNITNPKICVVTKIAEDNVDILGDDLDKISYEMVGIAKKDAWFISAEQSKIRLQQMKEWVDEVGVRWVMPIRKLAALPYIFEQLYGKSASLAERITQLYVEEVCQKFSPFLRGNILTTSRGQRGRPTLEAKRQGQLTPVKTLKSFWSEEFGLLRGRFELLDKEKPTTLLDSAHNIEAFVNLFLGIRLLHYQRSLKGLVIIMGVKDYVNATEMIKHVRYLFKRVSGQIFFVSLKNDANCAKPQELETIAKGMNIKAKAYKTFAEAFQSAREIVDERHGLLCITGNPTLITDYWQEKGLKRFA